MLPAKTVQKFANTVFREILISTEDGKGRAEMAVMFGSFVPLRASPRTATSISQLAPWVTELHNGFGIKLLLLKIVILLMTVQNHGGKQTGLFEHGGAFWLGGNGGCMHSLHAHVPPGTGCRREILILDRLYQDFTTPAVTCGFMLAIKTSGFIQDFNTVNPQGTTAHTALVGSGVGVAFQGRGSDSTARGECGSLEHL